MATSLGGVTDPAPNIEGEEEAEEDDTPKKEEAAKDGIAEGGFNAGKVEEFPRKLPEKGAMVRIGSHGSMGEERTPIPVCILFRSALPVSIYQRRRNQLEDLPPRSC